ncbi:MAG: hypothetical protein B6D62_03755 [Candidatus Cloacimonas sp. 4484_275]|nr:MAG: hypothetical protein B6D62_03755 [Candidatus Cloacimonas sp. 4484_275]
MKKIGFFAILILWSFSIFSIENMETILYEVSVVGNVKNPGIYRLPPTSRVSEAINRANYVPEITSAPDEFFSEEETAFQT